ncbi:MAG: phage antirepressor [Lawsonella sp.]
MSNCTNLSHVTQYEFEGYPIRVIEDGYDVLFCGRDVATVLGYKRPNDALNQHCKGTVFHRPLRTAGGTQEFRFINEGDLYRLIVSSKLPSAQKFEHWVFDDVLPSIRKHGGYLTPEKLEEALLNPDTLIRLAQQLKEEQQRRAELEAKNKELAPKAGAWSVFCGASGDMSVADAAKALKTRAGVEIGRNRLFEKMRALGWLTKTHGYWEPLQYAAEREYLSTRINMPRWKRNGESFIPAPTVRVTPKGFERLAEVLGAGVGV